MRVNKPALHPMVRGALLEIQSGGVEITPEIVVWLQDAALAIRKLPHRPDAEIMDTPVMCGGVWLYPPSFAALHWLMQLPTRLQNDSRVLAFACAHSRDRLALERLSGTVAVTLAVAKWSWRLTCSKEALAVTVDRLIGCEPSVDVADISNRPDRDKDYEWGTVIKSLCLKYPGTSPDYWLYDVSRDKALNLIATMQSELPSDLQWTEYEIDATNKFRSIVESIKASNHGG